MGARTAGAARAREGQEEGVCTAQRLGPLLAEGATQLLRVGRGTWKLQSRERKAVSKPLRQRGSGHPGGRGGGRPRPEPRAGSCCPPSQQGSSLTRWDPSLQRKPTPGKGARPPCSGLSARCPGPGGVPARRRGKGRRGSLPVSHLGPSQAGHGLLQVLAQIQDVLHSPLPLGLGVWREERSCVSGEDLLPSGRWPEAASLDESWHMTLPLRPS